MINQSRPFKLEECITFKIQHNLKTEAILTCHQRLERNDREVESLLVMLVSRVRKTLRRVRAALAIKVSTFRFKNAVMCPNAFICVLFGVCLVALGLSVVLKAGPVSESLGISSHLLRPRHYIGNSSVYMVERPPDKRELGRATWTAFHTLAANFPEKPTDDDRKHAEAFVRSLTRLYPCKLCRDHFDRFVSVTPPEWVQYHRSCYCCRGERQHQRRLCAATLPR
jgi:hypothetical protein